MAANRYSVATGNWNSTSTWSATSGGGAGASIPAAGDVVTIERGFTVTVNGTYTCASLQVGSPGNQTFITSGAFTVPAEVTLINVEFGVTEGALYLYIFFPPSFSSNISTVKYERVIKLLKPCAL